MTRFQKVVVAVFRFLHGIFLSWEIRGRENVPLTGPLVVAANHVHLVDPVLLGCTFPRWITYMAKQELFRYPLVAPLIRWAQAFSIPRRGTIKDQREALEQARNVLSQGLALGVFPEGKRDHDGRLLPGKPGAAVLASRTSTPVVPVAITGTEKLTGISWLWRRPLIVITIGQSFSVPAVEGRLSRSQSRALTDALMSRIAALLPEGYRGAYGD
jgi:1-acyl-sn-glycerol-3-phosphate acyltransferase